LLLALACGESEPAAPNTAPVVEITTPATDIETSDPDYNYDGYDDTEGLWYADVLLEGDATDAEDGTLGDSDLVWVTDRTDLQDAALGSSSSLLARLYSDDCFGVSHSITLTATDSDGESRTAVREIFIWTLC
jgi:hypothetical protein